MRLNGLAKEIVIIREPFPLLNDSNREGRGVYDHIKTWPLSRVAFAEQRWGKGQSLHIDDYEISKRATMIMKMQTKSA